MRGLKLLQTLNTMTTRQSHPSWVRGLKQTEIHRSLQRHEVAPLVGAWIETRNQAHNVLCRCVAPLVGAWIETAIAQRFGLMNLVAPLVGAWIETGTVQ